jgi:hypothetical protein
MGYYTDFKIVTDCKDNNCNQKIVDRLSDIAGYELDYRYGGSEVYLDSAKWYSSEEDMKLLSSEFADILFTVYGDGEESDDLWVAYYKNGKGTEFMKPSIIYPLPIEDEFK